MSSLTGNNNSPVVTAVSSAAEAAARLGPADAHVAAILDLAAARPLALDAFLRVAAVEWNAGVSTACVECADRPRMLLNPLFVERMCGTRERLTLLVLHELSHISLGHTRLYSRTTVAHNIAFDVVINATILTGLQQASIDAAPYAALLESMYEPHESPWFLLRPPPGWPERRDWEASRRCPSPLRAIHRRLYGDLRRQTAADDVTYGEILALLHSCGGSSLKGLSDGGSTDATLARLLGSHGETERERSAMTGGRDAAAADALGVVLDALPGSDAGPGGELSTIRIEQQRCERALERALAKLLRRVFVECDVARSRHGVRHDPVLGVDPSADRRAPARRALARRFGAPVPLLFHDTRVQPARDRRGARIYVDASGSMSGLLERLHAALIPLRRLLSAEVYVFSTCVAPISFASFARGELPTTGGTSVEPVLRHALEAARAHRTRVSQPPVRALVLTDGYFDSPDPRTVWQLRSAGVALHVGVIGDGPLHDGEAWVASSTRLLVPTVSSERR